MKQLLSLLFVSSTIASTGNVVSYDTLSVLTNTHNPTSLSTELTAKDQPECTFIAVTPAETVDDAIVYPSINDLYTWRRQFSGSLDVRWFGAAGDGTTDDQPAIQAALDAADKRTVSFPNGTYLMGGTGIQNALVMVTTDVSMMLEQGATVLSHQDRTNLSMFDFTTAPKLTGTIEGGTFDDNASNRSGERSSIFKLRILPDGIMFRGIHFTNTTEAAINFIGGFANGHATVRDCKFTGSTGHSGSAGGGVGNYIFATNSDGGILRVEDCTFIGDPNIPDGQWPAAIHVTSSTSGTSPITLIATGNFVSYCGTYAHNNFLGAIDVYRGGSGASIIADNIVTNYQHAGIRMVMANGGTITGNKVQGLLETNNVASAIGYTGQRTGEPGYGNVVISDNVITDSQLTGITISGSPDPLNDVTVHHNMMSNVLRGITLNYPGDRILVQGNNIVSNTSVGIRVTNGRAGVKRILDNVVDGYSHGFYIETADSTGDYYLTGNRFKSSWTSGVGMWLQNCAKVVAEQNYVDTAGTLSLRFGGTVGEYVEHANEYTKGVFGAPTLRRDLHSMQNSVINVKDFGAVGDGTTDDTAAWDAAIAAAGDTNMVVLPGPGLYMVDGIGIRGNTVTNMWTELNGGGAVAGTTVQFRTYEFDLPTIPANSELSFTVLDPDAVAGQWFKAFHWDWPFISIVGKCDTDGLVDIKLFNSNGILIDPMVETFIVMFGQRP